MSENANDRQRDEQLITEGESCVVYTANVELEARVIEDALRDAGIPVVLSPHVDGALDTVFAQQLGWGDIIVLAQDSDRAKKLIAELEEELAQLGEELSEDVDESDSDG